MFAMKLIHCARWLGWWRFKWYKSADNCSHDGACVIGGGCGSDEDYDDCDHEKPISTTFLMVVMAVIVMVMVVSVMVMLILAQRWAALP